MSWQERRCNAEGFGRPEPFFSLCEERTYSPPAKQAVVSLPAVGPCALPEASTGCFSRGGSQCRSFSNRRHCLCGWQRGCCPVCRLAANPCPLPGQAATRLRKPATGSFIAEMDAASPSLSTFFRFGKRNKTAPYRGQKGSERLWQSITWKPRW